MTVILDDYNNRKVLNIISYKSGVEFVRNFIILDTNPTEQGFITLYEDVVSLGGVFSLYIFHNETGYLMSNQSSQGELVNTINDTQGLREAGMSARLLENYTINGTEYGEVVRIETDGTSDFRDFSFQLNEGSAYESVVEYSSQRTNNPYFYTYFVLMPFNDNQITFAEDETSILKYGRKLYRLTNLELLTNNDNKQLALDNKLAELKDPKARMVLDIPFDSAQLSLLNEVEIQLSYRNVDQFRSFKEGGHFKSWDDAGDYRTKTFYIVGISHQANINKTRLKLIEKES